MKLLSGKNVAESIFSDLLAKLKQVDEAPRLLSVIIGDNPAAVNYARAKGRKASALGAEFNILSLSGTISSRDAEKELRKKIKQWDPDGIIIERPVPEHIEFNELVSHIPPVADIDCQRMDTFGMLCAGRAKYIPATAKAVIEIMKFYNIQTEGKNVTIVGRSITVGLPLSMVLMSKSKYGNATVCVCHSRTKKLAEHTKYADIIVVAVGKPGLLKENMVSEDTTVIDVGTTYKDGKLYGDVDFENVAEKVSAITPVPGGVGPVTTVCLFQNLITAALERKKQKNIKAR